MSLRQNILVLGAGQSGLVALGLLHDLLQVTFPPRELSEHLRLLAIAQRQGLRQEQRLPRESRLLLTLDPLHWADVPGRFSALGVAKWWPRTPKRPDLQNDPTSSRAFGRLLLWANSELVSEKLYDLSEWLLASSQRQGVERLVFIVGSLAEAESSGMLFDLAGRIRALLHSAPSTLIGVFSTGGEPADEDERLQQQAQVYVSLKELQAALNHPQAYPHTWPALGRSQNLPRTLSQPFLDSLCLSPQAIEGEPEGPVSEFILTWLLQTDGTGLLPPNLKPATPYSQFRVSKLATPVRAVLESYSTRSAQRALQALALDYNEPYEGWLSKIMHRAHTDLASQTLREHPHIVDKMRELRRRLSASSLRNRTPGGAKSPQAWLDILSAEWDFLRKENQPEERDLNGIPRPRDVLRRRADEVLNQGLMPLCYDLESLAVTLSFGEGWGLVWTARLYETLAAHMSGVADKMSARLREAERELEGARQQWFALGTERQPEALLDKSADPLLEALFRWVTWQAREVVWDELASHVQSLAQRLHLSLQQQPERIRALEQRRLDLERHLEAALHQPSQGAVGVVFNTAWCQQGLATIPSTQEASPRALLTTFFKRWQAGDTPPALQLQKFPQDILSAARLTLQPQASFAPLGEFLSQYPQPQALQNLLMGKTPPWPIVPSTNHLDQIPPQALMMTIVREGEKSTPLPENVHLRLPSPDPDEITLIRLWFGWQMDDLPLLRNEYRRAYNRLQAEGLPLHLDRRWETTMADLVQAPLQTEVNLLWEAALQETKQHGHSALHTVEQLSLCMASALECNTTQLIRLAQTGEGVMGYLYPLKPLRLKIPPPICGFLYLLSEGRTEAVVEAIMQTLGGLVLDENFFFLVNLIGRPDQENLLAKLREKSYQPLLLDEGDFKHIINAPRPLDALRDFAVERINLSTISPFFTRAPVPDHMFFGREREIAEVRSKLATHSVVLIGGRRIGKTSTLQKVNRTFHEANSPATTYYIDCSQMSQHAHFFRRLHRSFKVQSAQTDDPTHFDEVVQELTERHPTRPPIFLLDEVDILIRYDQQQEEPLLRAFRALSNERRCQFVFSGEKTLLRALSDPHSVLFNFPKLVKLNPLRPEVVRRLVSEPFEMLNIWLEQPDSLIQQIYEISAGHPNIVQTICQALVEAVDRDKETNLLKQKHLGWVLDQHQVQTDIVETMWGQMHPFAKLATLIWEENAPTKTLEDLFQDFQKLGLKGLKFQHLKDYVIPDLELYNFILRDGTAYRLLPIHFPTILDEMTNKHIEIRILLEDLHRELELRTL